MLPTGTVVDGKFEILSALARGGFGVIYQARQLGFDRVVALKVLQANEKVEDEDIKRFEREARILSTLRHKNLVMFYGFGSYQNQLYMAMELITGESLEMLLLRKIQLSVEETIPIVRQICEALQCVHTHGVVHRDLKPMNIMLCDTPEGTLVKLIDFGLARLVTADVTQMQTLTEAGNTVGSVEYMSPEQCIGSNADARSDIYAVGCVLQHCLTGAPPFTGESSVAVMKKHVQSVPKRLNEIVDVPQELQFIVDKALAKQLNARYQSMDELLNDLRSVESGGVQPLLAYGAPAPVPLQGKKPPVRTSPLTTAFVLTTVVLALALGTGLAQYFSIAFRQTTPSNSVLQWREGNKIEEGRGRVNVSEGHPRRVAAIECYTAALEQNRQDSLLDDNQLANIYARLATLSWYEGNAQRAKQYGEQAIALLMLGEKYNQDMQDSCAAYAMACNRLGKAPQAVSRLRKVCDQWRGRTLSNNIVRSYLAESYLASNQPVEAHAIAVELAPHERLDSEAKRRMEEVISDSDRMMRLQSLGGK